MTCVYLYAGSLVVVVGRPVVIFTFPMINPPPKTHPMPFPHDYSGFMPIWGRFAPTTTLQLIIFEQLRSILGMKSL